MIFTRKTLENLEYDKIVRMLCELSLTEGAAHMAEKLLPSDDYETVLRRQTKRATHAVLLRIRAIPHLDTW